jgi:hypothetical protein
MSEQVVEELDDLGQPAENGELVHWMERKPLAVGPAAVSAAVAGAFVLGAVTAVVALALMHWLGPQRPAPRPRRRPF